MVLEGLVGLVTGAGQGIGKASALELAAHGADVAGVDIDMEAVEETCAEIRTMGRRSIAIQADMGSVADIESMTKQTVKTLDPVDVERGGSQHLFRGEPGHFGRLCGAPHRGDAVGCQTHLLRSAMGQQ